MDAMCSASALRQMGYVSTKTAAKALRVKPATLYAYVSRGLVEAHHASDSKESFFAPGDLRKLRDRPRRISATNPITSAITLLQGGALYYRGTSAVELARSTTFEDVAERLWGAEPHGRPRWVAPPTLARAAIAAQAHLPNEISILDRLAFIVTAVAARDPFRYELSASAVRSAGAALIRTMVEALPSPSDSRPSPRKGSDEAASVAQVLAARLALKPTRRLADALDAALIVVADHGLAASTLAARVAAYTRAPIYSSVAAALAALQGPRHGFASAWAEELLARVAAGDEIELVVEEHLRRGETLWYPPVYEGRDPRAALLLEETLRLAPQRRTRPVVKLLEFAESHGMPPAGAEFALAAFAHSFGLRRGGGQAIFAIGRTAGWIAHAMEEHASPSPLRMRATYIGTQPDAPPPD
jgi:citrate synthase